MVYLNLTFVKESSLIIMFRIHPFDQTNSNAEQARTSRYLVL